MKTILSCLILVLLAAPTHAQPEGLEVTAEDLYYEARAELRAGDYAEAAAGFAEVVERHPDDELAGRALYWRAFALSRQGDRLALLAAKRALEEQFERYPDAARDGDSAELAVEIRGELAQLGDADAAADIARLADDIRGGSSGTTLTEEGAFDDETRLAALNALLQMDPQRAMPILQKVLTEKPENYSTEFRERAVFLLSQNAPDRDTVLDTFMHVIENDPSDEVREQAVFWLSQTKDPRVVDILEAMVRGNDEDPEIRDKAIFALSQVGGARAHEVLRDLALDETAPHDLRAKAVFWMSQLGDERASDFLVQLFRSTDDTELKDKALFSISQLGGAEAREFMASVVRDEDEPAEVRKQALFWMSQLGGTVDADVILQLFRDVDDVDVREQAIFALSQLGTRDATAALIDIARDATEGELREKAVFWLGQSTDPEARDFLADLVEEEF